MLESSKLEGGSPCVADKGDLERRVKSMLAGSVNIHSVQLGITFCSGRKKMARFENWDAVFS